MWPCVVIEAISISIRRKITEINLKQNVWWHFDAVARTL